LGDIGLDGSIILPREGRAIDGGLDLLYHIHSHSSVLQAIQRYRFSAHFPVHCYTRTRILSLH
jgi:hypothetical protein